MKRNWVTKVGIILGIVGASFMAADGAFREQVEPAAAEL